MKRMSRLSYSTGLRMREIKHGKWVSTEMLRAALNIIAQYAIIIYF